MDYNIHVMESIPDIGLTIVNKKSREGPKNFTVRKSESSLLKVSLL